METAPPLIPPKALPENKNTNVWTKSLSSLLLYVAVGYFFFRGNWQLLLILTAIVVFHELGHFIAMKIFNYTELGIFFIPLLGAYASGTKKEVSQTQSAIILLAGPLPGIIIGIVFYLLASGQDIYSFGYYSSGAGLLRMTGILLIFLNLLNLLPIYPLDGGQLLNRLLLDDSKVVGKIFVILSALALSYFIIKLGSGNRLFYVMLFFPVTMLLRLRNDSQHEHLVKKIEDAGINLEKTYEEITDEEYWQIRNILIENNYPLLRNINPAPPYEYSANEDKVVTAIENMLQRTIIMDLNWAWKIFIIVLWLACFSVPFLLDIAFPFWPHRY